MSTLAAASTATQTVAMPRSASGVACYVVTIVFGAVILYSYSRLARRTDSNQYWGGLEGPLFKYWLVSALVTAPSFLFLVFNWCFLLDEDTATVYGTPLDDAYAIILSVLIVFLVSAALWVTVTIAARNGGRLASFSLTVNLWTTALASVALFLLAIGTRAGGESVDWKEAVCSVAGFFVASHHVVWDAEVWRATFDF